MAKKSHRRHTTKKSSRNKKNQQRKPNEGFLRAITRVNTAELKTLKIWEINNLLSTLRKEYDKRVSEFDRSISSPAIEKMEEYYSSDGRKKATTATRESSISELRRLRDFFSQKTSSQQGAERVWYEQDKLIFGTDKSGEPLARMDKDTREAFWKIYNEYLRQNPSALEIYYSRNIFTELGEMYREGDQVKFDTSTLATLKARLERSADTGVVDSYGRKGNVYSGRRRDNSK